MNPGPAEVEGEGGGPPWDLLIRNVHLATLDPGRVSGEAPGTGTGAELDPGWGAVSDGALAVSGGRIAWVGRRTELPARSAGEVVDGGGGWLTPGLVDCHTHLVWAGSRGMEFERRLGGVGYARIAREGGGILATVEATRRASVDHLVALATGRLEALMEDGVTTVEIKSGYGLDLAAEGRMLEAARELGERLPVEVVTTFLGAHAVPAAFTGRSDAYLEAVMEEMLPELHARGLVDAVDVFCEGIAFSVEQADRLFSAAERFGLPVKAHAEQLSLQGGAALVARHGGLSADHLEYLDEAGVRAMAEGGTVAVLLPGAFHHLREEKKPPVDRLREAGVPIAVATDANPGSSPLLSLRLAMNLAALLFGLSPAEALAGATREGACALGLKDRGILSPGLRADMVLWRVEHPAELVAQMGGRPMARRWIEGAERRSAGRGGGGWPS